MYRKCGGTNADIEILLNIISILVLRKPEENLMILRGKFY